MVRSAYPTPGLFDKFYDADMRPLLRVFKILVVVTIHLVLLAPRVVMKSVGFQHLNCSDNMSKALARFGVAPRAAWPAINFFGIHGLMGIIKFKQKKRIQEQVIMS